MRKFTKYPIHASIDIDLMRFDDSQKRQIRLGLESGVDVSVYADPKFDWYQMEEIRLGLESGVDVSVYADPELDEEVMEEIRLDLEQRKASGRRGGVKKTKGGNIR